MRKTGAQDRAEEAVEGDLRLLHVEKTLLDVAFLMVSSSRVNLKQVLSTMGEALGARCLFVISVPEDEALVREGAGLDQAALTTLWHREGEEAGRRWLAQEAPRNEPLLRLWTPESAPGQPPEPYYYNGEAGVVIPMIGAEERLLGYLGMEYEEAPSAQMPAYRRSLNLLGDLLVNSFRRSAAEQDRRHSEERWRKLVDNHPDPLLLTLDGEVIYANRAGLEVLGAEKRNEVTGRTLADFVPSEWHGALAQNAERLRAGEPSEPLEYELRRLDGAVRAVEAVSVPVVYKGRRVVQTIWRDITEAKKSAERYRTFVQTMSEALWCVELEQPLPTTLEPDEQVQRIREGGYLAECNVVLARLLGSWTVDELTGRKIDALFPDLAPRPLRAFIDGGYRLQGWELSAEVGGRRGFFVVNASGIVERGRLLRIWGSCLEVTERVELEKRMVAMLEEQQEHIGRELHDNVGQLLTAVRMMSSNLAAGYFEETDEGYDLARKVSRYADEASQNVRGIYHGLVPPSMYQEGVAVALQQLAQNIDELPGVACHFEHDGQTDVAEREVKLQLFRIAQEAVNNALKHARAKNIWISLDRRAGRVRLAVRDDGVGFTPAENTTKSLGLHTMHHRAQSVNAELIIDAAPRAGTTVTCLLDDREPA